MKREKKRKKEVVNEVFVMGLIQSFVSTPSLWSFMGFAPIFNLGCEVGVLVLVVEVFLLSSLLATAPLLLNYLPSYP